MADTLVDVDPTKKHGPTNNPQWFQKVLRKNKCMNLYVHSDRPKSKKCNKEVGSVHNQRFIRLLIEGVDDKFHFYFRPLFFT